MSGETFSGHPAFFFFRPSHSPAQAVYTGNEAAGEEVWRAMRGGCHFLGLCALALGLGILITAIFPVGALLFLISFLLIGCGWACMRRR